MNWGNRKEVSSAEVEAYQASRIMGDPLADDLLGDTPTSDAIPLGREEQKVLLEMVRTELMASRAERAGQVALSDEYERMYDMQPYEKSELLTPTAQSIRLPTTSSRVDQAVNTVVAALAVDPFTEGRVDDGQDGRKAKHVASAINQQLRLADASTYVGQAVRHSMVTTLGILKTVVVEDERGRRSFDISAPRMRDVYMSPHNVRELSDCTMVAEVHRETLLNIKSLADSGFYDWKAVEKIGEGGDWSEEDFDPQDDLNDLEATVTTGDSSRIRVTEAYIRVRSLKRQWDTRVGREGSVADRGDEVMYRVFIARSDIILRVEEWTDGLPYHLVRHDKRAGTVFSNAYTQRLRDIQYNIDQLFSASLEQDRLSLSNVWAIDPQSTAWKWAEARIDKGEVAIQGGEVMPAAPGQMALMQQTQTPMQINQRVNMLENYASQGTISTMPFSTVRSATETRFVAGSIQSQEQQLLRSLRSDLEIWLEYTKRLYWRHLAVPKETPLTAIDEVAGLPSLPAHDGLGVSAQNEPVDFDGGFDPDDDAAFGADDDLDDGLNVSAPNEPLPRELQELMADPLGIGDGAGSEESEIRYVQYGSISVEVTLSEYAAVRLIPRGTSTNADQILAQQGTQFLMAGVLPNIMQQQAFQQAGVWPQVWSILRYACESYGLQNWMDFIGENPAHEEGVVDIDPQKAALGMALAQGMQGGGTSGAAQQLQQAAGMAGPGAARQSDGAVTSNPADPAANGMGAY